MNRSINRRDFLKISGSAFVGALLAGCNASGVLEKRRIGNMAPASRLMKPNVLLIVMDTVRASSLSAYGYHRQTVPFLEKIAEQGVLFELAISTSPWTLPSHASMFTGRYPYELFNDWWIPLDDTYPTIAESLNEYGYSTAGFIANTGYASRVHGLDRGFLHYEDFPVSAGEALNSTYLGKKLIQQSRKIGYHELPGRKTAPMVNQQFLHWLENIDKQKPFFAFLNYFDAHNPFLPPQEFALRFASKVPRGYLQPDEYMTHDEIQRRPDEVRELNDAYDASIAYLDHHIGLLFEALQRRSLLEDTLVIIVSDHGEQFGEHGLMFHANSLYMPLLHVPLIILFPRHTPTGKRIKDAVSLRDIPATIVNLLGLESKIEFPGESLARYWSDSPALFSNETNFLRSEVRQNSELLPSPVKQGSLRSLIWNGMHYIKNFGSEIEEFYDLTRDRSEEISLVTTTEYQPRLETFRRHMESLLDSSGG